MRFEDGFEPEWREILAERISADESKQLLERLATSAEFGEGDITISAICEATGSTPSLVSRIIADIRGVSWQKEFGDRIAQVEERLDRHAEVLTKHEIHLSGLEGATSLHSKKSARELEIEREMRKIAEERIRERQNAPYTIVFAIVIAIVIFLFINGISTYNRNKNEEFGVSVGNGRTIWVDGNGATYTRDNQGNRQPVNATTDELLVIAQQKSQRRDSNRR